MVVNEGSEMMDMALQVLSHEFEPVPPDRFGEGRLRSEELTGVKSTWIAMELDAHSRFDQAGDHLDILIKEKVCISYIDEDRWQIGQVFGMKWCGIRMHLGIRIPDNFS